MVTVAEVSIQLKLCCQGLSKKLDLKYFNGCGLGNQSIGNMSSMVFIAFSIAVRIFPGFFLKKHPV